MADIGHIATKYELEAIDRLKVIVVPYPEELLKKEGLWDFHEFIRDEPTTCSFAVGDRIYFQEKWCKGDWGTAFDDDIYFTKSTTPEAENIGWQPASTMPPQAAQYWFEIERVRVAQMGSLDIEKYDDAGFAAHAGALIPYHQEIVKQWNAAYPEQPWNSDRWIIGLDVTSVS